MSYSILFQDHISIMAAATLGKVVANDKLPSLDLFGARLVLNLEGVPFMSEKPRILLVDDSEATVEGLKSFLDQKYEVLTAYNGLDALKDVRDSGKQVDLVITDLVMPIMSGFGVISVMRQKSPETPIIAMTGWGKDPSALATDAKADVVLMKPFDLEDLDQSVSKLLADKPFSRAV